MNRQRLENVGVCIDIYIVYSGRAQGFICGANGKALKYMK